MANIPPKDKELFRKTIFDFCPRMTEEGFEFFSKGSYYHRLKPKDFFIREGQPNHEVGFVTSGLIRGFYLTEKGEESTVHFVPEGEFATHYGTFVKQRISRYSFQCLEETSVIAFSYVHLQECYEKYPEGERLGRLIAEAVLVNRGERLESFQFRSPEERYLDFLDKSPTLFNRVSLTHLASFLGIERTSLSRIRKRLSENNAL